MNISFVRKGRLSISIKQLKSATIYKNSLELKWADGKEQELDMSEISKLTITDNLLDAK